MSTKTFSGRVDEADLAYADALVRERFGMSFGQYCSSVLIEAVRQGADLPSPTPETGNARMAAAAKIKQLAQRPHNAEIAAMTDAQIKDLIGSRYE